MFVTCHILHKITSIFIKMCKYLNKMYDNSKKDELWQPCENLVSKCKDSTYAVIILNTPITLKFHPSFLLNLWSKADLRITVDGGTERWLAWLKTNSVDVDKVSPPQLITGDMDSLSLDSLKVFGKTDAPQVIKTPDQNETDFTKALRELKKYCVANNMHVDVTYVISDTSGRFDQICANINTLHKALTLLPDTKIFQVASNSLTWLLDEGRHTIHVPGNLRQSREWCALIPFATQCHVSTTGLKWNLDNTKMEFGGMVSTSNTYNGSPTVTVNTDNPIIWSMGIESLTLIE